MRRESPARAAGLARVRLLGAIALTVACAWVPTWLAAIPLPTSDVAFGAFGGGGGPHPLDLARVDIAATWNLALLGVQPALLAFVLVELVAAAVPRWRRLRHGGPAGRAPLRRAVFLAAGVLGALQFFGLATVARAEGLMDPGVLPFVVMLGLALAGTAALMGVAWLVGRFGVANGLVVATLMASVPLWLDQKLATWGADDRDHAWHLILAGMAVTVAILAWAPDRRKLPLSGLMPLTAIPYIIGLLALIDAVFWTQLTRVVEPMAKVQVGLLVVLAVGMPWLALRRTRATIKPSLKNGLRSVVLSAAYILALHLLGTAAGGEQAMFGLAAADFIFLASVTAALWDVVTELDARLQLGPLARAWPFHDLDAAQRVTARLNARGVPTLLRGERLHTLLRILGPWVPAELWVPPESVALARELATADQAHPELVAAAEALS